MAAARAALDEAFRYPDPLGGDLKRALAKRYGVDVGNILLGNGSHELLMQFAQVFASISFFVNAGIRSGNLTMACNGLAAVHGGRYIYPHQTKSVLGDAPVPCRRPVVLRQ